MMTMIIIFIIIFFYYYIFPLFSQPNKRINIIKDQEPHQIFKVPLLDLREPRDIMHKPKHNQDLKNQSVRCTINVIATSQLYSRLMLSYLRAVCSTVFLILIMSHTLWHSHGEVLLEGDVDLIFLQSNKAKFCRSQFFPWLCVVKVWNRKVMNSFLSRT